MTNKHTITTHKDIENTTTTKTIGLLSDTHIPSRATTLPREIFTIFQNVDYIIHAGDIVELSVIDELKQIAPTLAVHGNMDTPETKNALPQINTLNILDKKIGVIHDPNITYGMDYMRELTKTNNFDILIYGHTHTANINWDEKTLYINPGSPTSPSSILNKPSVALLQITKDTITPKIINI